jgi:hypothetical protein
MVYSSDGSYGDGEHYYDLGNSGCGEPTGACCWPDESCTDGLTETECANQGGTAFFVGELCADVTCPFVPHCEPEAMFSNPPDHPDSSWAFNTSELTPGYKVFDDFSGLTEPVGNIRFWATQLHFTGTGWEGCEEPTVTFEIGFYPDSMGMPERSNPTCIYTVDIPSVATGRVFAGFATEYQFETDLDPCCDITDGWISIQGQGDTACWILWGSSGGNGGGAGWQEQDGVLVATDDDQSMCLMPCGGGPGCDYVVGDVNGSDNYNGLDITYGVNFFKYGTPEPQCDPDCPPCAGWHYCGDVNASCNYNGLDITYGVNYFKYGVPGPVPCDDCPPIGITGENSVPETPQVIKSKTINLKGSGAK